MKVVIIPGVGYQSSNKSEETLGKALKKELDCEFEVFNWTHIPIKHEVETLAIEASMSKASSLAFGSLRRFFTEVILDFEFALKFGDVIDVTSADYYVGHSAGSLLALAQNKPCTIMGSPAALVKYLPKVANVESLFVNSIANNKNSILNLVNKYDVIAYPMNEPEVNNVYFRGWMVNPLSYFPLTAHTGYWKSGFVADEIVKHVKSVVEIV